MEPLSCRSPSNCRTCEHFAAGAGCELELEIDIALQALAAQERPRIPVRVAPLLRARA